MRNVKEALKWSEANISDEEDLKMHEAKYELGDGVSLDLQSEIIINAFRFGYYVGAHSKQGNGHLNKR